MEDDALRDLLRRFRDGDESAAEAFLHEFEPALRRHVRVMLAGSGIEAAVDVSDILQSLYLSFYVRARAGEFDLDSPAQVRALLNAMARNKVLRNIRHERAALRDRRRLEGGGEALRSVEDSRAGPSRIASARELLAEVYRRLPPDIQHLSSRRGQGCSWPELARELNENPDTLRMRLQRALDELLHESAPEDFTP